MDNERRLQERLRRIAHTVGLYSRTLQEMQIPESFAWASALRLEVRLWDIALAHYHEDEHERRVQEAIGELLSDVRALDP